MMLSVFCHAMSFQRFSFIDDQGFERDHSLERSEQYCAVWCCLMFNAALRLWIKPYGVTIHWKAAT